MLRVGFQVILHYATPLSAGPVDNITSQSSRRTTDEVSVLAYSEPQKVGTWL